MTGRVADVSTSPLLQQYREIKSRHRDAILFFRMGDFYEMFFEDAEVGARALDITLTSRGDGVPLAGVPVKAASEYLRQLLAKGFRVAICEQVEDPKLARGLVRREVVETVTPGAVMDESFLSGAHNNFLAALAPAGERAGLAAVDLSTGEFILETVPLEGLDEALSRLAPAEIIAPAEYTGGPEGILRTTRERWEFDPDLARDELGRRFELSSLDGLGLTPDDGPAVGAAGALLRYLAELQPAGLPHLARPTVRRTEGHLWIDDMTRRNLELVEPLRSGTRGATLLEGLDVTATPMGARLLRRWLLSPLADPAVINERLDAVEVMTTDSRGRERLREALDGVRDLERLAGRAAAGRATPRELGALRDSFQRLPDVLEGLSSLAHRERSTALTAIAGTFDPLSDVATGLAAALQDRPPASLADGDVIRPGYDPGLDELRGLRDGGKQYIASLQQRERDRTGIPSLKVGFNKVFGYYLEITHAHAGRVPADYERRQTLSGAERYVTPELKEYESKVLGAEEHIATREAELFSALRQRVGGGDDADPAGGPRYRPAGRLGGTGGRGGPLGLRPARDPGRLRAHTAGKSSSRDRAAHAPGVVHAERRVLRRRGAGPAGHGTEHGGEVHHPPADRTLRGAGPDGGLRAGGQGPDRGCGPAVHPGGGERQSRAWAIHVHGGNE